MEQQRTLIHRSWPVGEAAVRAAESLGLGPFFLRLKASELPEHPWLTHIVVRREGGGVRARAPHLCGPQCPFTATGCLTALKVEEMVSRTQGRPFVVASLRRFGEEVEVLLQPFP